MPLQEARAGLGICRMVSEVTSSATLSICEFFFLHCIFLLIGCDLEILSKLCFSSEIMSIEIKTQDGSRHFPVNSADQWPFVEASSFQLRKLILLGFHLVHTFRAGSAEIKQPPHRSQTVKQMQSSRGTNLCVTASYLFTSGL